jgi:hypothetical protein
VGVRAAGALVESRPTASALRNLTVDVVWDVYHAEDEGKMYNIFYNYRRHYV